MRDVFITGGTGYIGKRLISCLLENGFNVIALVRKGSENKLPQGTRVILANPFDSLSFQHHIPVDAVFV